MLAPSDARNMRVVQIFGAPGIGKSRLLHEFLSSLQAQACSIVRFAGDQHRGHVAFHAITAWLRTAMSIAAVASKAEARNSVAASLDRMAADLARAREWVERLLALRETETDGESTRPSAAFLEKDGSALAQAVAEIIFAQAGGRRTILACEDIDHFDAASRELLIALIDVLATHDVLVVTTSRARTRLRSGGASRVMALSPLSSDETVRLLEKIDKGFALRPALTSTIVAKAGGNPLFVEEVATLVLQDRGTLDADERVTAKSRGEVAEPVIPDRVEALIGDRLSRLPVEQKRLLQLCAVVGLDVPVRLLAALTGTNEEELYRRLTRLGAEQLLYQTGRYPDPQFSFRHALIRDVAYRALLATRRREIHADIVAALERDAASGSDRKLDELCFHTLHARQWEKAIGYFRDAASVAASKYAFQIAHAHIERALALARNLPDSDALAGVRLGMLLELRGVLFAMGRYPEMAAILDEAEALAERLERRGDLASILIWRVHVLNIVGNLPEAVRTR